MLSPHLARVLWQNVRIHNRGIGPVPVYPGHGWGNTGSGDVCWDRSIIKVDRGSGSFSARRLLLLFLNKRWADLARSAPKEVQKLGWLWLQLAGLVTWLEVSFRSRNVVSHTKNVSLAVELETLTAGSSAEVSICFSLVRTMKL